MKKLLDAILIPLAMLEDAAISLRQGDFSKTLSDDSRDEFGMICIHVQESFDILREIITNQS